MQLLRLQNICVDDVLGSSGVSLCYIVLDCGHYVFVHPLLKLPGHCDIGVSNKHSFYLALYQQSTHLNKANQQVSAGTVL